MNSTIGAFTVDRTRFDEIEHTRRGRACRQGPLGRALNHRAVGERLGERNPDLEHIGARAIERIQNIGRTRQIRIAGRDVGDEAGALLGPNARRMPLQS